MTKKLFTQIKNEWRSNTWLALELLVVSVVMWYIVDYIYTQAATAMEPRGFDIEHCYLINMGRLTDKSPDYIPDVYKRQILLLPVLRRMWQGIKMSFSGLCPTKHCKTGFILLRMSFMYLHSYNVI